MTTNNLSQLSIGAMLLLGVCGCGGSSGGGDDGDFRQRDRMGMPAVNTALVNSDDKDSFNEGDPSTDQSDFKSSQTDIINGLRAAVAAVPGFPPEDSPGVDAATVVTLVNPDVLHLNLSLPDGFPNGRKLTDDTINPIVGLVLNRGNVLGGGPGISDGIDTPKPTIATFPYAGPPNP